MAMVLLIFFAMITTEIIGLKWVKVMEHSLTLENIKLTGAEETLQLLNIMILMVMERQILSVMLQMVTIMLSLQKVINLNNNTLLVNSKKLWFKKVNKLIIALLKVENAHALPVMFIMEPLKMEDLTQTKDGLQ